MVVANRPLIERAGACFAQYITDLLAKYVCQNSQPLPVDRKPYLKRSGTETQEKTEVER